MFPPTIPTAGTLCRLHEERVQRLMKSAVPFRLPTTAVRLARAGAEIVIVAMDRAKRALTRADRRRHAGPTAATADGAEVGVARADSRSA